MFKALIIIGMLLWTTSVFAQGRCVEFLNVEGAKLLDSTNPLLDIYKGNPSPEASDKAIMSYFSVEKNPMQVFLTQKLSSENYVLGSKRWELVKTEDNENTPLGEAMVLHFFNQQGQNVLRQTQIGKLETDITKTETESAKETNQDIWSTYYVEPVMSYISGKPIVDNGVRSQVSSTDPRTLQISFISRVRTAVQMNERSVWTFKKLDDGRLLLTIDNYRITHDVFSAGGERNTTTILLTPVMQQERLKTYVDLYLGRDSQTLN